MKPIIDVIKKVENYKIITQEDLSVMKRMNKEGTLPDEYVKSESPYLESKIECYDTILDALKYKAYDGWISVKDDMPENNIPVGKKQLKVLVAIKGKNGYTVRSQVRFINYDGEWAWRNSAGEITHWQFLPKAPKE